MTDSFHLPKRFLRASPIRRIESFILKISLLLFQLLAAYGYFFMRTLKMTCLLAIFGISMFSLAQTSLAEKADPAISDTDIRRRIIGTWIADASSHNGTSMVGAVTFDANGTLAAKIVIIRGDRKEDIRYEGTWQVERGKMIETVTRSNAKWTPVGKITRDTIIRVDDDELVFKTEGGKTVTRRRRK